MSWVQARDWSEIAESYYVPEYGSELYPCPISCSEETFVLRVHGVSMEPKFHEGDLIFVDPNTIPLHGKYIVVQIEEPNEATFTQLIIEGDKQYLKALNPDWPRRIIEVDTAATICGVVVFKGEEV
ncbi:MAG: S24 family peptidase [Sedimenticola sp.]